MGVGDGRSMNQIGDDIARIEREMRLAAENEPRRQRADRIRKVNSRRAKGEDDGE